MTTKLPKPAKHPVIDLESLERDLELDAHARERSPATTKARELRTDEIEWLRKLDTHEGTNSEANTNMGVCYQGNNERTIFAASDDNATLLGYVFHLVGFGQFAGRTSYEVTASSAQCFYQVLQHALANTVELDRPTTNDILKVRQEHSRLFDGGDAEFLDFIQSFATFLKQCGGYKAV